MPHRDDFDLAPDEIYLNGAYSTPLPRAARDRVAEAYALQAEPYRLVPDVFFEYTEAVRDDVARVLGASSEEVAVTTSTSFACGCRRRTVSMTSRTPSYQYVITVCTSTASNCWLIKACANSSRARPNRRYSSSAGAISSPLVA